MHHFLFARLTTRTPHYSVLLHNVMPFFTSRTLSVSSTNHHKDDTFNVFSLINSCGLSPEIALKLSKRLELKNTDGPNAVIEILRNYGFSDTQLCSLVKKIPFVLLSKPEKTLLPKLKFFLSIGFSTTDLPRFLIGNTSFLGLSLDKTIIPRYNIIKSLVHSDKKVVSTLKNERWYFNRWMSIDDLVRNVGALRHLGVPQRSISLLVTNFPCVAFMEHSRFVEAVEKVKVMGFDSLKSNFVLALSVLATMNEAMWESKLMLFEKWGWSRDICLLAFKKHPEFIMSSEEKIMKILNFLMKDIGLPVENIAGCPDIVKYNLEKTVMPRFAVVEILKSRGLIKRDSKISSFIKISEKRFLERYVIRFQKDEPLLLDAYRGVAYMKRSKFVEAVKTAKKIGCDPLKVTFVKVVHLLLTTSKAMWDSKFEVYERWGWSSEMALQAFGKFPNFMMLSKETYTKKMSFLVKDMGLPSEDSAVYPLVISYIQLGE